MPDPRTDRIAQEAARLIETGRIANVHEAILQAVGALKLQGVPLPGVARVRKHAQAMSMQAMGQEAYEEQRKQVWNIAEQIMTVFEQMIPDVETLLVGRAAKGQIDGGVTIHIRLYTRQAIEDIARSLVELGYEEPTFQTIDTAHGRLNQVRLVEEGHEIVLTRCLPEMAATADVDLFSGKPIETMTVAALRRRMDEKSP